MSIAQQVVGAPPEAHAGPPVVQSDFDIVPLRGLPIVGVILAGLVAAIATNSKWGVDFFHVASGAFWTVLDLFLGFVLGPILGRLSIPARVELTKRLMPKMVLIMPTVVVCTLAAGWQLAHQTGDILLSSPDHPWVVASMVVVGVMAVVALGLLEPANVAVLFELKKERPDGAVVGRLMKRFIYSAGVTGAMQVATLVIMSRIATK
ncbi:MAG: hypothetical protein JWM85_2316 [Acidimicrobiaceae bacterium]|nr:hypothetical protein [Acidimicrobiaceae bacterium]